MKRAWKQESYRHIEGVPKSSGSQPNQLTRILQSSLFLDWISCVLLTSGLGFAVLALMDFAGGFWNCFVLTCASVIMVAVFALRWWVAPVVVVALFSAATLYCVLTGRLEEVLSYWSGFFTWALQGLPSGNAYSEQGGAAIMKAAILFMIALVWFVLIRKLFFLPVILFFACAGFAAVSFLGHTDLSVPICVCAAGMIILLPRVYARYVSVQSKSRENRGAMQVIAIPAAILALLVALYVIPEDTSAWRSRGLNNLISDIAYLFEGPFASYPSSSSAFSMKDLGFGQENGALGGPVKLTDKQYLYVSSSRPILLRGTVLDAYTGERWQTGAADGDFRFESLFWRGYRNSAFGLNQPLGSEAKKLLAELTDEQELTVTYHSDRFNTVFAGGTLRDARFKDNSIAEPIYFNMRSELYLYYRIPKWVKLQVKTSVWNSDAPGFEERFLRLEEMAADRRDNHFPQIRQRYTRLPDTVPERVQELALQITAERESPYQKAKAIEQWLREHCEYTLEPDALPENTDFVGHFLDTRKGYCTYYASAMAVLARCVGLPSRYVTGFALEQDAKNTGQYYATGKTAHAWAEIYFNGIGWMAFDPLDWNPAEPLNQEQIDQSDSQTQPASIPPQISAEEGASAEKAEADARTGDAASIRRALSYVAALVALYVAARLMIYRIMGRKSRIYQLSRVSRKIPDLTKQMDFYFDDILKQLSLLGVDAHAGETLKEFSGRVDRRIRLEDQSFATVAHIQTRMHFADIMPEAADCEAACRYHSALEAFLHERLGKTAYFFQRAISR